MSKIISSAILILATSSSSAAAQDLNVLFLGDQRNHKPATRFDILTVERHEVHGHNVHHAASDKQAVDVEHAVANLDDGDKPNILFLAIDDLNDYISPLDNHPGIKTPNFERLARRSVTFSNAHCAAPACHPSRVAVMTGVHPVKSGIYRNLFGAHGPCWRHESLVLEDAVVISQHLRNHGYRAVGGGCRLGHGADECRTRQTLVSGCRTFSATHPL